MMKKVKKILKIVAILIAAFIILGILFVMVMRACNYLHHKIMYKHGVNESSYIELNGQKQFVTIKGENRNNPVIIYLHGGPGGADSYMNYCFSDYLTDEYTVVSWDQRGCGRTYYKNAKADPLNKTVTSDTFCSPNPAVHAPRFGLFRFRSPLLTESMFLWL